MNKYNIDFFYHALAVCFKSVIQSGRSLFLSKIKNTSLKLPVGVSPLQLVNLHRNRRYFVLKLHTWFCLSYFLKTNIIQLLHLNEINMRFYGAEYNNIERGECRVQYCCTLLHKTSYWSSSSVVIVLLHTALCYS